jgi:membrane protein
MVFGRQIEKATIGRLLSSLGWREAAWWSAAGLLARYLVAIGAVSVTAAMLYFAGPNRRQRWRGVWPGAILATALWLIATSGFAWYVRNLANYNVVYGSVGTSIALLVWMYLLSAIALLGAEFNAQLERRRRGIQANAGL